ncbi:MAG: aminopeptidase [Christensenellales bacterium]|jgi:aminopeptidase
MPDIAKLREYAELAVRTGANVQTGQKLTISAPVECASFVELLSEAAFDAGASDVEVFWNFQKLNRLRYKHVPVEVLTKIPQYLIDQKNDAVKKGAALISVAAADPTIYMDVPPDVLQAYTVAAEKAFKEYYDTVLDDLQWTVVSVPTAAWTNAVFPGDPEGEEKLWDAIFKAVRLDEGDAVARWKEHTDAIRRYAEKLNNWRFVALHFQNGLGTDLMVGLRDTHLWSGGASVSKCGVPFNANMPTEEVFTTPDRDNVNGVLKSSLPLCYNGVLIRDIALTFRDGGVVAASASEGEETLRHLLDTDEGARRLGEVALVPHSSPISKMGILFYNTMYDENASCHFALGKGFVDCVMGGADMTDEEKLAAGVNDSMVHVDFMVGTADMSITGITKEGERVPVFIDGEWAL